MAPPHPALRATFSRKGRRGPSPGLRPLSPTGDRSIPQWQRKTRESRGLHPSPLAGEGAGRSEADEGIMQDKLTKFARNMRKAPTGAEAALWRILRNRRFAGYKFRRQAPIGDFIADFVCFEARLIVRRMARSTRKTRAIGGVTPGLRRRVSASGLFGMRMCYSGKRKWRRRSGMI